MSDKLDQQTNGPVVVEAGQKKKLRIVRFLVLLVLASGLFFSGYGIGSGRISINGATGKLSVDTAPTELDFTSVEELYRTLRSNFDGELDMQELMDGMKQGMAQATGDPYTEFFNAADSDEFNQQLSGSFSGIGAELGKDGERLIIISPIAGFPAAGAGLLPKDAIVSVNGESTSGWSVSQAVDKIRGETGTKVKLGVIRNDSEALEFEITRAQINIPSVKWEAKGDVGVITVSRYWDDTAELAEKAASEFKAKGINKIVLDLRSNPGGSLNAAVDLSSLWLEKGDVVLREKRGGEVISTLYATGNNPLKGYETVVLINEGSASASEITAGALRDNDAAKLMGIKSFGKGSVQKVIPLKSGGTVKITIARWFTPNDKNIDKEGIPPDTEVKRTIDDIKVGRDPQMDAALAELR